MRKFSCINKKLGRLQTKVAGNWATYCTVRRLKQTVVSGRQSIFNSFTTVKSWTFTHLKLSGKLLVIYRLRLSKARNKILIISILCTFISPGSNVVLLPCQINKFGKQLCSTNSADGVTRRWHGNVLLPRQTKLLNFINVLWLEFEFPRGVTWRYEGNCYVPSKCLENRRQFL